MHKTIETGLQELVDALFRTADAGQRRALEETIARRCRSLIHQTLKDRVPWMMEEDREDCASDCWVKVWQVLRQRQESGSGTLTEGYVAEIVRNHVVSLWRRLHPDERLLHDKVRSILETDPRGQGLALRRAATDRKARFVVGFATWLDQVPRILRQDPAAYAVCKQYLEGHWGGDDADAHLPALIAGILTCLNAPVLLSELVDLLWEVSAARRITSDGHSTVSLEELSAEISEGFTPFELPRLHWLFDRFWKGLALTPEGHRRAFLFSQPSDFWDYLLIVVPIEEVARMVKMQLEDLLVYRHRVPLEGAELARLLKATPQQVFSMKQHAQRQLQAWMSGTVCGIPAQETSGGHSHRRSGGRARERHVIRLTTGSTCNWVPAWSPDGKTIAFLSNRTSTPPAKDLWLISPDGSRLREAAHSIPYAHDSGFGFSLAWIGKTGDLMVYETNWRWEIMRFRLSQLSSLVTRARVDGSDRNFTQILAVPGGYGGQAFDVSPDGKKLAWSERCAPHEFGIVRFEVRVGDLDSLSGETTTAGAVVFATTDDGAVGKRGLSFSPDGSRLCISAIRDGWRRGVGFDLYVLDLRTGKVTRLTCSGEERGVWNLYTTWSCKDLIAFSSAPDRTGPFNLYLIRPDGSDLKCLRHTRHNCIHPSWSPDGSRLAFAAGKGNARHMEGCCHLYVMRVT